MLKPDSALITVRANFGKQIYFPEISLVMNGPDLLVCTTVKAKTEVENGWTPAVVEAMLRRVLHPDLIFHWDLERDISLREWSLLGTCSILTASIVDLSRS